MNAESQMTLGKTAGQRRFTHFRTSFSSSDAFSLMRRVVAKAVSKSEELKLKKDHKI